MLWEVLATVAITWALAVIFFEIFCYAKTKKELGQGLDVLDLATILEFARVAMADAVISDQVAEDMDVCDEEILRIRDGLQKYMDS